MKKDFLSKHCILLSVLVFCFSFFVCFSIETYAASVGTTYSIKFKNTNTTISETLISATSPVYVYGITCNLTDTNGNYDSSQQGLGFISKDNFTVSSVNNNNVHHIVDGDYDFYVLNVLFNASNHREFDYTNTEFDKLYLNYSYNYYFDSYVRNVSGGRPIYSLSPFNDLTRQAYQYFFGQPTINKNVDEIGYLAHMQDRMRTYVTKDNSGSLNNIYIDFGWDQDTTSGYSLTSSDVVQIYVVADVYHSFNQSFEGKLVASNIIYELPNQNAAMLKYRSLFAQNFAFLDNQGGVVNAILDQAKIDYPELSSYNVNFLNLRNIRYVFTPYRRDGDREWTKGGDTILFINNNIGNDGIYDITSSEGEFNSSTGGFTSNDSQVSSGSGNNLTSSGDSLDSAIDNLGSLISGSDVGVSASNYLSVFRSLVNTASSVPSVISSLFTWLPSWCINLVSVSLATMFVIGVLKAVF